MMGSGLGDGIGMIRRYVDIVNPYTFREAVEREVKIEDSTLTLINVVAAMLVSVATVLLAYAIAPPSEESGPVMALYIMQTTPLGMALTFLNGIVVFYVGIAMLFGVCRLLGGNGKLGSQLYAMSVVNVPFALMYAVLVGLSAVQPLDVLASLASLAVSAFSIYVAYKITRAAHRSLDTLRSASAIVAYMVLEFLFASLLMVLRIMVIKT